MFGPVHVPSLRGTLYYVIFIDDFSRNTWLYFLKRKSKVFNKFKEFNDFGGKLNRKEDKDFKN